MNEKKVTSFAVILTGEGYRITYTYSVVSPNGDLVSQNNKGNFISRDENVNSSILNLINYIENNR